MRQHSIHPRPLCCFLYQFSLLNYTSCTADINNSCSSLVTYRWKKSWNSASLNRITAVPCTQMQAGIPAKKKEKHRAPRLLALTEYDKTKRHSTQNKCPVALLSALPSASVSASWTGFVLLLCQDVAGLNRWGERVYQWRTLRLCSSKVFPRFSPLQEKTVCQAHCRNSPGTILAWKYNALAQEKGDVRLQRWPPAGRWCRRWGCEPVEGDDDIHRGSRFHLTQPFLPLPPLRWWCWRALVSVREGGGERGRHCVLVIKIKANCKI